MTSVVDGAIGIAWQGVHVQCKNKTRQFCALYCKGIVRKELDAEIHKEPEHQSLEDAVSAPTLLLRSCMHKVGCAVGLGQPGGAIRPQLSLL